MKPFFLTFLALLFISFNAFALTKKAETKEEPSILKADKIDGDQITNIITATGNVEVKKGSSTVNADKMSYDKNSRIIKAYGNVKMLDIEIGNVRSKEAQVKDDFTSGVFFDNTLVLNDGSYLYSIKAERKNEFITVLDNPIYSICPNPEISDDNSLAGKSRDMFSIKSKKTTINRENQTISINHGILRFYNVPFLYSPFISLPLLDKKRKSGFLTPSYLKNSRFGLGVVTPYFVDIAPNMDLTILPKIYTSNSQFLVENKFRHLTDYGQYNLNFEIANNKVVSNTDKNVINRSKKAYRWHLSGDGEFTFSTKTSLDYNLNYIGDRNYLRDYYYSFLAYTISDVKLDYTDGRKYYGSKLIKVQELVDVQNEKAAPLVFPLFTSYNETKPFAHKEKYALSTNATIIQRDDGLQYRRLSATPEAILPLNLYGNLFNFNARLQTDLYSLENKFRDSSQNTNYNQIQTNYKPEISASWRLPLIHKANANTLMIEPMVNFVSSVFKTNYNHLPNEDNDSELTVSNLFTNDRISGYDRNEAGQRVTYGAKSSMFNRFGQFGLTAGQSFRITEKKQDVSIRGFKDNNKSNLIGQLSYKIPKLLDTSYSFQLNESNYLNEVNSVAASIYVKRFTFATNYLLLRKSSALLDKVEQASGSIGFGITKKLSVQFAIAHDFALKRTLSRRITFDYGGCCVLFNFSVSESNPANLTRPQKSYQVNMVLKNL